MSALARSPSGRAVLAAACVLAPAAATEVRHASARGGTGLSFLSPAARGATTLAARLAEGVAAARWERILLALAAALVLLAVLAAAAWARRETPRSPEGPFLLGLALAAAGQGALLSGRGPRGLALHAASLLVLAWGARVEPRVERGDAGTEREPVPGGHVLAGLLLVFAAATRFHALDVMPGRWDGETALHMAVSTTFAGAVRYAFHLSDPYITQGFLWFAAHGAAGALLGTSLLTARIVYAVASVLAPALLYAFLRRVAGPRAALLGAAILLLMPLDLSWSRIEYFFALPGLAAIGLVWATYALAASRRPALLAAIPPVMALPALLYPAGRALVVVPLVYLPARALLDRLPRRDVLLRLAAVAAGIALYLATPALLVRAATGSFESLRPVGPLWSGQGVNVWWSTRDQPLASRLPAVARHVAQQTASLAQRLFVRESGDEYGDLSTLAPTTLLSAGAACLAGAGLVRALLARGPCPGLLVLWVAASLPAGLVTEPNARRMAALFPALAVLAALAADRALQAITRIAGGATARIAGLAAVLAFAAEGTVRAGLCFDQPATRPFPVAIADAVRPRLTPGTLVLFQLGGEVDSSVPAKVLWELLDDLRRVHGTAWVRGNDPAEALGMGLADLQAGWATADTWLRDAAVAGAPHRVLALVPADDTALRRLVEQRFRGARSSEILACADSPFCRFVAIEAPWSPPTSGTPPVRLPGPP